MGRAEPTKPWRSPTLRQIHVKWAAAALLLVVPAAVQSNRYAGRGRPPLQALPPRGEAFLKVDAPAGPDGQEDFSSVANAIVVVSSWIATAATVVAAVMTSFIVATNRGAPEPRRHRFFVNQAGSCLGTSAWTGCVRPPSCSPCVPLASVMPTFQSKKTSDDSSWLENYPHAEFTRKVSQPDAPRRPPKAVVLRQFQNVAVCLAYIAADGGKLILVSWLNSTHLGADGKPAYSAAAVLLCQQTFSLLLALTLSAYIDGSEGFLKAVRLSDVLRFVPVSMSFVISKVATILALAYLDAGTVKIATQIILPCSALLSRVLLARHYKLLHWLTILTICLSSMAFNALQIEGDAQHQKADWTGLAYCVVVILSNSFGSLLGEMQLRKAVGYSLPTVKSQLLQGEILVLLATLMVDQAASERGWFTGWDWRVIACAIGWVPSTWLSTLVTRRFSTVTKNVLQCASTMATVLFAGLMSSGATLTLPTTLLAWLTVQSVLTFVLIDY